MRDPKLVFKAQLAAAALERAWQRWRVVHGLVADPMPTISSYVGYSLEEPWGQPRVVFGLSADDAEQLAALLDRHDCVGPVHATIAAEQGGREHALRATDSAVWPQVPSQAPPLAVEQSVPASREGVQGRAPRFVPTADRADEQDGPVFREVVAAVQKAAAARGAAWAAIGDDHAAEVTGGTGGGGQGGAHSGLAVAPSSHDADREDGQAASGGHQETAAGFEPAARTGELADEIAGASALVTGWSAVDSANAGNVAELDDLAGVGHVAGVGDATRPDGVADSEEPVGPGDMADDRHDDYAVAAQGPAGADEPASAEGSTSGGDEALAGEPLTDGATSVQGDSDHDLSDRAATAHDGDDGDGDDSGAAVGADDATESADGGGAAGSASGVNAVASAETASGPETPSTQDIAGSTQTASGAETGSGGVSAERGRRRGRRESARQAIEEPDVPGPLALAASAARVEAEARIRAALRPRRGDEFAQSEDSGVAESAREPVEAKVADRDRRYDVASSWSDPELDTDKDQGSEHGAVAQRPDQPGTPDGEGRGTLGSEPQGHAPSGHARRSRITRGYAIPRLSRAKRPGAMPGAEQPD